MAKKKGLAARYNKRAKKNSDLLTAKANPPPLQDIAEFIVPGFVGYAGTRLASRIVHGMMAKRFPKLAKHASAISTLAAAGIAWLTVHRIERFKQYHTPVVVGSGIAAIQTVVQAYLPKYGWIVSDHEMKALPAPAPSANQKTVAAATASQDDDYDDYDELYDTSSMPLAAALTPVQTEQLRSQVEEELSDVDLGVLSSNFGDAEISDEELEEYMN